MATTGRPFTTATVSLRMAATKHFAKGFAERPSDGEACCPSPLVERRDDAALERFERVADHRRVVTNGPSRNPALIEVGQRGASGVLLAPTSIVEKHRLPVISALRDVMRKSWNDKTWHSGHASKCAPAAFISSLNEPFHFGTIIRLRPYFWRRTEMISSAVITPVSL